MVGIKTLSELRDRLELMLSISAGSPYVDSTPELEDINEAFQATAYAYDWPSLLTRRGIVKVADLDRYSLPSDFRKARTVKLDNITLSETEHDFIKKTRHSYVVDRIQDDIIVNPIPTSASTAYTFDGAETAANAVTIDLDTVSGLTQHDEIWIDSVSGTDEFTMVSSIDSDNVRIVARLDSNKSASDVFYRVNDIIDIKYYRLVTLLSASSDVTLLPAALDYIMLFKAASLAYIRLEQYAEAKENEDRWRKEMQEAWLAMDKGSTGSVTQFSV